MSSRTPASSPKRPQSPSQTSPLPSRQTPLPSPSMLLSNPMPSLPSKLKASKRRPTPKQKQRPGKRLLSFDRRLGARYVAGADEAGRGSLAGPLVVAGVLLDYESLRDHRVRPLALLNDSKQVSPEGREELYRAIVACAQRIAVRVISHGEIDRVGLHRCNLAGLRSALWELSPPAEVCLVDGFRLGPQAPIHTAVVDGDERSAAIAAASVVAKVTRDRLMRRMDALYPHYGFSSH